MLYLMPGGKFDWFGYDRKKRVNFWHSSCPASNLGLREDLTRKENKQGDFKAKVQVGVGSVEHASPTF